ncbi:MAG TPA: CotH kinase family protein [Vicinamibacterales bacterium]|nr:CotH kinase family protein [Vicinamibacterales bacterium]
MSDHHATSRVIRAACLLALLLLLRTGSAGAQTAATLFDDGVLHTLKIAIHSRDWARLRSAYLENTHYPADLTWNGLRVTNVGVRSRGRFSRNGVKPGLTIDFAHYSTRGQFLGLRALVLDNLVEDKSMIRERVAMAFLRRFGVPAPRAAFARVFVNGQYAGLYAMVEEVDRVFAQHALGDANGALFEYRWLRPYFGEYLGDDLDLYRPLFEPRTREYDSVFSLYDPIRELIRAINYAPAESFREAVGMRLDLAAMLRLLAAEVLLGEADGIASGTGMNNFYLHRHSTNQRHQLLPWDRDLAFFQWNYPVTDGTSAHTLIRRALEDPELRSLYAGFLVEAVQSATDADWLGQEVQRAYEQIREAVLADPVKPYTNEEFEAEAAVVIDLARRRPAFVLSEVQRLFFGRQPPLPEP